jgi:hypothetical protein
MPAIVKGCPQVGGNAWMRRERNRMVVTTIDPNGSERVDYPENDMAFP